MEPVAGLRTLDGRDEHPVVGEPLQHLLGVGPPAHHITERRLEDLEHRGVEQELPDRRRLQCEHFFEQQFGHGAVGAAEAGHHLAEITFSRCQQGEPKAGRPALRAGVKLSDGCDGGVRRIRLDQLDGFAEIEREVGSANLCHSSAGSLTSHRHRRIGPAHDHDVHSTRQPFQEPPEVNPLVGPETVHVVDHDDRRGTVTIVLRERCDEIRQQPGVVEIAHGQGIEDVEWRIGACRLHRSQQELDDTGPHPWIGVEAHPGPRLVPALEPASDQGRLARAGRTDDERPCGAGIGAERRLLEPWPPHQSFDRAWRLEARTDHVPLDGRPCRRHGSRS